MPAMGKLHIHLHSPMLFQQLLAKYTVQPLLQPCYSDYWHLLPRRLPGRVLHPQELDQRIGPGYHRFLIRMSFLGQ